jgi:RNA polymerase sigma-70 factor (ECF subfamily)
MNPMTPGDRDADVALVLRAQRGDTAAFHQLIARYDRRLLYFVLRLLPDADLALDILQEVWLTLFRRLDSLRAPEAFRVWLYQIAHDRAIDVLRKQRRQEQLHEVLREDFHEPIAGPEESLEQAELVHHALRQLSPEHREVLLLRFLESMSLEEIAQTLRCSLGTVKSRLHYARQALRCEVEKIVHD